MQSECGRRTVLVGYCRCARATGERGSSERAGLRCSKQQSTGNQFSEAGEQ